MNTQVLRNSGERLLVTFTIDGIPTDADGAVTVTITADAGTAIATAAPAPHVVTGVYSYILAPQANLDHLTAVWSGEFSGTPQSVTTYVDIVGGYYVSLAELLAMKNLGTNFTAAQLIAARQWFETTAERHCHRAFVPRYKRQRFSGTGGSQLLLDFDLSKVRSVRQWTSATAYTDFTTDQLAAIIVEPSGVAFLANSSPWPWGTHNLEIVYEHGAAVCPDDIREAAKTAIALKLLDDFTGQRQYSIQTDLGLVRMSVPGPGRPTGIPAVDEVLNANRLIAVG